MTTAEYRAVFLRMRHHGRALAAMKDSAVNTMLRKIAKSILASEGKIIAANKKDMSRALALGKSASFIDRLRLDKQRIRAMAAQVIDVSRLPSPLGKVLSVRQRPNGLKIRKVSVPLGTLLIIYEARPNVTSDVAALCLKSGNAAVLRGGSDALESNRAVYEAVVAALPVSVKGALFFVRDGSRKTVDAILKMNGLIDAVIPRGGEGLIAAVVKQSRIPVIYHGKGVCNLYVHSKADIKMAVDIALNAKVSRPGVCNAIENILVDRSVAEKFLPKLCKVYSAAGVEMRGCRQARNILPGIKAASKADWDREYLDKIIAIKVVDGIDEACDFINTHGSGHSEAIVTSCAKSAAIFFNSVDAACLYHNASTRFTDGGEFGMGAEIGISNQKLHPRGPVGLEELTSYKYLVSGSGQIRK